MKIEQCPKCSGSMEEGFILDVASQHLQSSWVEGAPNRSFWFGIKVSPGTQHPVATFRCDRCGFLESYARGL